jgi:hypothetical protein
MVRIQKKSPEFGSRGVKGGMDMGYRVLLRTAYLTARAAIMRDYLEIAVSRVT